MKKRLISLLLAVAMMVAVVPTAAFAGDEASIASSKTLSITADGKPDVTGIVPNPNNADKKVYTGTGWKYEVYPNADYLYLQNTFDLSSQPAVTCSHVVNQGTITGGTFRPDSWTGNWDHLYPGYVENLGTISGGIFVCEVRNDTTSRISGGIFVNDPEISNKHTIHIINHGRITKLNVGSKEEVAMDTENLYIVGTLDSDLKLTLDDGTVHTVSSSLINGGHSSEFPKPVPLVITSDGIPDTSNMTQDFLGCFVSDDWLYVPSEQTLCLRSGFKGSVGPNPVKCQVENAGIITGGVFYGMVSSAFNAAGTIQGGIFLGNVATDQTIKGGVFVHAQVNDVHAVSSPAELGKIKTITLGNDTVTLDEPVDSFHFGGTPTNLSVTLEDGTVYKNIDTSTGSVKLEPKPEEPDYYTVIVEGGEARNEMNPKS